MNQYNLIKGIYATFYGNACYVSGPKAKRAFDLDSAEYIPISEVDTSKYIRPYNSSSDSPASYKY